MVWGKNDAKKSHGNRIVFQRAENGALDPPSLGLRLGHPGFLPQIAPKPFKGSAASAVWTENWGTPAMQT